MAAYLSNLVADVKSTKNWKRAGIATLGGTAGVLVEREVAHQIGKIGFLKKMDEKSSKSAQAVKSAFTMLAINMLGIVGSRYVGDTAALSFVGAGAGHAGAKLVGRFLPSNFGASGVPHAMKETEKALGVPLGEPPKERAIDKAAKRALPGANTQGALPDGTVGRNLSPARLHSTLNDIRAS